MPPCSPVSQCAYRLSIIFEAFGCHLSCGAPHLTQALTQHIETMRFTRVKQVLELLYCMAITMRPFNPCHQYILLMSTVTGKYQSYTRDLYLYSVYVGPAHVVMKGIEEVDRVAEQ